MLDSEKSGALSPILGDAAQSSVPVAAARIAPRSIGCKKVLVIFSFEITSMVINFYRCSSDFRSADLIRHDRRTDMGKSGQFNTLSGLYTAFDKHTPRLERDYSLWSCILGQVQVGRRRGDLSQHAVRIHAEHVE